MSEDISSFLFVCPQCGEEVELPEAFWGMPYTCKQCSHQTVAKGQQQKECPWCGELIKAKAKICRFCQRNVIEAASNITEESASMTDIEQSHRKQKKQVFFKLYPNEELLGEKTVIKAVIPAQGCTIKWTNQRLVFCDVNKAYLAFGEFSSSNQISLELSFDDIIDMDFCPGGIPFSPTKKLTIQHIKSDSASIFYGHSKSKAEFLQQIYEWWTTHYKE